MRIHERGEYKRANLKDPSFQVRSFDLALQRRVQGSCISTSRSVEDDVAEQFRKRATYLERILKHYAPELDFGTESLRQKAHSLVSEEADPAQAAEGSPSSASNGDITIQDESCTINAVNENIARKVPQYDDLEVALTVCRLLW